VTIGQRILDPSPFDRANVSATLAALRAAPVCTTTELATATGLSRPTVEDALARLVELSVVEELAPATRGKGRPARNYRFRPEAGVVLGLDIGEHRVAAIVADLAGSPMATVDRPVRAVDTGDHRLATARTAVRAALGAARRARSELWAAGVGTPGVIDLDGRVLVSHVLPDWTGRNLGAQLRRSLTCPIQVNNDANLAAYAEHWRGGAVGTGDIVYVHASHRIGAGILIGGRIHRGYGGAAGEIGTLRMLHWDTAARHLTGHDYTLPADELDAAADAIFEAARTGDGDALAIVDEFAHDLAAGIASMSSTVDPELVVIGGRVSRAADVLIPRVGRRLKALCLRPPRLVGSTLDDGAVALGAARTALDDVERRIFKLTA
jgi:predicted NBD/HSP70 family sugar kinase